VSSVGDRYDSTNEDPATKLPSYTTVDLRVRYRFEKFWSVELAATNLFDRRLRISGGLRRAAASVPALGQARRLLIT
jgi:outer membrane receptor protein involved in Fe transport